jgi:hypothetical protein
LIRWAKRAGWRAAISLVFVMAVSAQAPARSPPAPPQMPQIEGDEWRVTNQSMLDLVDDGYELVSVVSSSNQSRTYFLRKPGKIAKCREATGVVGLPPDPRGIIAGSGALALPDIPPPEMRIDVECAELVRPEPPSRH